jgi:hypothetical protein
MNKADHCSAFRATLLLDKTCREYTFRACLAKTGSLQVTASGGLAA